MAALPLPPLRICCHRPCGGPCGARDWRRRPGAMADGFSFCVQLRKTSFEVVARQRMAGRGAPTSSAQRSQAAGSAPGGPTGASMGLCSAS